MLGPMLFTIGNKKLKINDAPDQDRTGDLRISQTELDHVNMRPAR